jgi:DUF1707 SHOCT-like domain
MAREPEPWKGPPGNAVELWRSFPQDPREPANAPLRASDADRDRIHQVLAHAFGDGRLDQTEFEERTDVVVRARTLGELPPIVADLLPDPGPALTPAARWTGGAPSEQAYAAYRAQLRQAAWGFISVSLVVWVIWALTSGVDSFPWPVFVSLAAGLNVLRTLVMRGDIIAEETRRLEKKQRRQLPGGDG